MFAVTALFTNTTETCLFDWGPLAICEAAAQEASTLGCYDPKSVKITEIADFVPTGTTADDRKVWEMLEAGN